MRRARRRRWGNGGGAREIEREQGRGNKEGDEGGKEEQRGVTQKDWE